LIAQHLTDSQRGKNTQFPFADLLRQSVYSRLAGYEDLSDAQRLSQDPTFRLIGSEKVWDRGAALTSRLQTFETDMLAAELLPRPAGRPSQKPLVEYKGFLYQAASWKTARRVVAKVEHHAVELFPRVGFIVTNLEIPSRAVLRFYNKRATVEQWIKEGKQAVKMTRLSCHRFRSNQVRLALSLPAYNLGNLWRRLALPKRIENWSLTSLQQRLVKTGGRLVKHARYYWLLLAEGHLNRRRFGVMLRSIAMLPVPAG
jgi:Transposase DDE domain group 1